MKNQNIKFQLAAMADIDQLIGIAVRAFEKDLIKYGSMPPDIETTDWHATKVQEGLYYKILSDTKIIGALKLYQIDDSHFRLGSIFIDPPYQNTGVGSHSIQFIENEFSHVKKWSLDTPFQNYDNQRFYENKGYKKIGETQITLPSEKLFILFDYEKTID